MILYAMIIYSLYIMIIYEVFLCIIKNFINFK